MPRTLDVIVRGEVCETCKAGDKIAVTGCMVVVPDVPALMKPGELKRVIRRDANKRFRQNYTEGVHGLKDLGARELTYRHMFFGSVIRKLDQEVETLGNQEDAKVTDKIKFTPYVVGRPCGGDFVMIRAASSKQYTHIIVYSVFIP